MQVFGEIALVFYGLKADAAPGVDLPSSFMLYDRSSWASVDALTASSAATLAGLTGTHFDIGQYDPDEEPAAALGVNQAGVLTEPAKPRSVSELALKNWSRIDANATLGFGPRAFKHSGELSQFRSKYFMVVPTESISSDFRFSWNRMQGLVVVLRNRNDCSCSRQERFAGSAELD